VTKPNTDRQIVCIIVKEQDISQQTCAAEQPVGFSFYSSAQLHLEILPAGVRNLKVVGKVRQKN